MFHKVKSVRPLPEMQLLVQFCEGVVKQYDVKPLLKKWPAFLSFEQVPNLFEQVQVDVGGYGIVWNDDIDLSCDELWENGVVLQTAFDGLLSFGDATTLWGLNESTLRKAIAYGKLVDGIDVQKFGKQWVITSAAMQREYGEPKATC